MVAEIKVLDGLIEDVKIKDYPKLGPDGTERLMKIGRIQIDGKGFTTFDEEIMKAFVPGDKVTIDYTEVVKGEKTFYNIKNIMALNLVKREGQEKLVTEEQQSNEEKLFPNLVRNPTFKKFDITKEPKVTFESKLDEIMKKVNRSYSGYRLNIVEVNTVIEGDEVKLVFYKQDNE